MPNYPSPHCHTQSFDSGSTPEEFAQRELELGTGTLTTTDHGSMGACRKVYDVARAKGLTPILGLEAYFRDDNCPILAAKGIVGDDVKKYLKYEHITLHALDEKAFSVLSQRLSHARLEHHGSQSKPLFNWSDLEAIGAENVTIGSGCLVGLVQRHILADSFTLPERFALADAHYQKLRSLCKPGAFYVEVFPHRCSHDWVSGIFLDFADGTRVRYYDKKRLRLERLGEMTSLELAKTFETKKWEGGDRLIGVKNYQKWAEQEPKTIVKVEHVRDFLQNECLPWCPDGDMQLACNRIVLQLAEKYHDPVIISDDSHFAHPDDKILQDVRLRQMGDWRFFGSYHRQSADESFKVFNDTLGVDRKTFDGWVDNNRAWGERFKGFTFASTQSLPTKFYPSDTLGYTGALIKKHGRMDWSRPEYVQRLQAEIDLLHRNGVIDLLPYMFVTEEACALYEKNQLLTGPGRGSAAGLLLAYLLGITHLDPLRYGLSMERFLTLDRVKSGKLPDIDQDLPHRDLLVDPEDQSKGWLPEKFGDHFAPLGTATKLKLKSAVKDVARAIHGFVPPSVEELAKKFVMPPQGITDFDFVFGYEDSGNEVPGSITFDKNLQAYAKTWPKDWAIAQNLLGLKRQSGRHACAVAIMNRPIAEVLPLEEVGGVMVTQFEPPEVEAAGAIKYDFLVVNSLNDIGAALKMIQERSGLGQFQEMTIDGRRVPACRQLPIDNPDAHPLDPIAYPKTVDIWDLPEDQAVYRDICEGKTETVFQFNTPGAVQWLTHFNHWKNEAQGRKAIDSLSGMAAFTALDRPGPLDAYVVAPSGEEHNMLVEYARRARGEEPVDPVPALVDLLPETYGVLCFQEGLQRVYQRLTGCPGPEAEEFRALVSKKKMKKVLEKYPAWMERVGAKLGAETAQKIWDQVVTFGQYGFNLSHAICYSAIAYACAYLKHYYPLEWWCAVLRNATKDEVSDKFWVYVRDLVDLPEIQHSSDNWEIVNDRLRAPTSLLHGVGPNAHMQLMQNRPYANIDEFCEKLEAHCIKNAKVVLDDKGKPVVVKKKIKKQEVEVIKMRRATNALNRKVCYNLIIAGVLDSLFPATTADGDPVDYSDKLAMYESALARAKGKKKVEAVDQAFWNLTPLRRFQMRKQVLPAYSEPLMRSIAAVDARVARRRIGESEVAFWPRNMGYIAFRPAQSVQAIERIEPIMDPIWVAVPAYVQSQRNFTFGPEAKEACEFILDIDGWRMKFLKWPGWKDDGLLAPVFKTSLKGAVVVATLCRKPSRNPEKPSVFNLEDLAVIQDPLSRDKGKQDDEPDEPIPEPTPVAEDANERFEEPPEDSDSA